MQLLSSGADAFVDVFSISGRQPAERERIFTRQTYAAGEGEDVLTYDAILYFSQFYALPRIRLSMYGALRFKYYFDRIVLYEEARVLSMASSRRVSNFTGKV